LGVDKPYFDTRLNDILINTSTGWNPYPERLHTEVATITPDQMVLKIVSALEIMQAEDMSFDRSSKISMVDFLRRNKIMVLPSLVDLTSAGVTQRSPYPIVPADRSEYIPKNIIKIQSSSPAKQTINQYAAIHTRWGVPGYGARSTIDPSQNFVLPRGASTRGNLANQYASVVAIEQQKGAIPAGYSFRFDCCRVEPLELLQSQTIKSGVSINASFYSRGDFVPVGIFKTRSFTSSTPIPPTYRSVYGMVLIGNDGTLSLSTTVDDALAASAREAITVGPVLVVGGVKSINVGTGVTAPDGKSYYHFLCKSAPAGTPKIYFDALKGGVIGNCNQIAPGELTNGGNPRPRSAIAIDGAGRVLFIYVEGSDRRGDGMDYDQLAELCVGMGAVTAIGLDGGTSSQMMWKNSTSTDIYQVNAAHNFTYPVGSIISFVKE
jgi:hypothetical protein